ncbi:MAG: hypothetical protein Q9225_001075 [Loekoesia sp. 1 TL-2023]
MDPTPGSLSLSPRRFNPLPNPYDIPGTRIVLDFDDQPDEYLDTQIVTALLVKVRRFFLNHIQQAGDGDIPLGVQSYRIRNIEFSFESHPQFRIMRYTDVVNVIEGFRQKMEREGYRERTAIVAYQLDDGHEIETGEVDVGRIKGSLSSTE